MTRLPFTRILAAVVLLFPHGSAAAGDELANKSLVLQHDA
jgi:hypothetical protein